MGLRFFLRREVWWDRWEMIDRDLDQMVHVAGRDIRLVVQVDAGDGLRSPRIRALVGDMFPLMNRRGLVSVEVVKPTL